LFALPGMLPPSPANAAAKLATAAAAAAAVSGIEPCVGSKPDHLPWPDTHALAAFAADADGSTERDGSEPGADGGARGWGGLPCDVLLVAAVGILAAAYAANSSRETTPSLLMSIESKIASARAKMLPIPPPPASRSALALPPGPLTGAGGV
jgi:hypothetical protein